MKILLTGAAGRLGTSLSQALSGKHSVEGASVRGDVAHRLDVTDYDACRKLIKAVSPDIVLHAAAWTDVDACALDSRKALQINGHGTQNVAVSCAQLNIPILYVSSNEVFDGTKGLPYQEYDPPNPQNAYGRSKWVGERTAAQLNPRHYIVRTAWLFAHGGGNFIQAILRAAEAGKPLRVVVNEVANPTYTKDLAEAIAQLIETERYGIYHLVNEGACSRWQFARYVLDQAGFADVPIERITRRQWQRPSTPPEYTAMENTAAASLGIVLRPWQESASAFLRAEGILA